MSNIYKNYFSGMKLKLVNKFKYILILLQFLFISDALIAQGIQFTEGNWSAVKEKASVDNKLIMVDVFTDWCSPCRWLEKEVFTNDSVGKFYNTNFVCWRIDAEKGEGINFSKEYGINGYPTILFINGLGKMVHKTEGSVPPADFIKYGETALNPELNLSALQRRYDNGERGIRFLKEYISALGSAYLPVIEIIVEYFNLQNPEEWVSKDNADIIIKYLHSADNKVFEYFVTNRNKFITVSDSASVYYRIYENYSNKIKKNTSDWSEADLNSYMKKIEDSGMYLPDVFKLDSRIDFYKTKKDWRKYATVVTKRADHVDYSDKDISSGMLNTYAYYFYININDKKLLKKALGWSKKAIELNDNYDNLDTYSSLYYKLGDFKNALKYGKQAVIKAKENGQDFSSTQKMIDNIQK